MLVPFSQRHLTDNFYKDIFNVCKSDLLIIEIFSINQKPEYILI